MVYRILKITIMINKQAYLELINVLASELLGAFLLEDFCKTEDVADKVPLDIDYYIERLAKKEGYNKSTMVDLLIELERVNRTACFLILLREVAVKIDEKYEDNIKNSPDIFGISTLNGKIYKIRKDKIKNYRSFSAFRTVDDAKIALTILKPFIKDLFKSGR